VDDAEATGLDKSRSRKAPRVPSATLENSSALTASATVRRLSHEFFCPLSTLSLYPRKGAKYCDEYVCLFVCLSPHITRKPHGRPLIHLIFMHVASRCGSVIL